MVEYDGKPTMKLSEDKETLVGAKQVFRKVDVGGEYAGDTVGCADETAPDDMDTLLTDVMREGKRIGGAPSLGELRERCARGLERLPGAHRRIRSPGEYPVRVSERLEARQRQVKQDLLRRMAGV